MECRRRSLEVAGCEAAWRRFLLPVGVVLGVSSWLPSSSFEKLCLRQSLVGVVRRCCTSGGGVTRLSSSAVIVCHGGTWRQLSR